MRWWKVAAFAMLIIAMGHLIFLFQESTSPAYAPYEPEPTRHVMIEADYFPILCDMLVAVLIISAIHGTLKKKIRLRSSPRLPEEEESIWVSVAAVTVLAVSGLLLYVVFIRWRIEESELLEPFQPQHPEQGIRNVPYPTGERPGFILAEPTAFDQFIVIMLSLIIIIIIVAVIVLMFKAPEPTEEPFLVPLPEYIIRRKEFTFDGNPRDVVINAYGAALDALHKKGVPIPEHFTPWEFQQQVESPHLYRLTQLFEKARYSAHDITRTDAQDALKMFRLIQQEEVVSDDTDATG